MSKVLLISLRDPADAMAAHEHMCFSEQSGIEPTILTMHAMVDGRPSRDTLSEFGSVLFGGSGAYSVLDDEPWIRDAFGVMQDVIDLRIPAYASCFGFQGLALALGGEVVRDDARTEMGATSLRLTPAGSADPVFASLPNPFWAQEGHHDVVTRLPGGVTLLATGDVCENQAFKVDGAPFWASQFHPELTTARTLDRFHHYRDLYLNEGEADSAMAAIAAGEDCPAVGALLAKVVRMGQEG